MAKRACLLLAAGLAWPANAGAQVQPAARQPTIGKALKDAGAQACKSSNAEEVLVCGRSGSLYRIDPTVLAATRAVEAPPPKPPLDASTDQTCVGPKCGGATIPLVAVALTALKAAELAAQGDDWREAFRTHPDAYQAYQEARIKEAKRPRVSFGLSAASK
ncbi:MAG: hypothetical protein HOP95_08235 [Sphingomonas sp.]|nr:hypothetical protein [Sphingomonas sp.]